MQNDKYMITQFNPQKQGKRKIKLCLICIIILLVFCVVMSLRAYREGFYEGVNLANTKVDIGKWTLTTYQAVPAQCDSNADFGAYGRVAKNGVPTGKWFACNVLPRGTKIMIPSISGNTVWTCRDKLNKRYNGVAIIDLLISKGAIGYKRVAQVFIIKEL